MDDRLYASSSDSLLAVIRALDNKADRVMFFGHNPEFSDLAHRLSRYRRRSSPTDAKQAVAPIEVASRAIGAVGWQSGKHGS